MFIIDLVVWGEVFSVFPPHEKNHVMVVWGEVSLVFPPREKNHVPQPYPQVVTGLHPKYTRTVALTNIADLPCLFCFGMF